MSIQIILDSNTIGKSLFPGTNYNFNILNPNQNLELPNNHFNTFRFIDKIEDVSDSEIVYCNVENPFSLYFDNFIWFCRIKNLNSCQIILNNEPLKFYYFRNKRILLEGFEQISEFYNISDKNSIVSFENKAVILPHFGWTDHIISVGLIRYYQKQFPNLHVIVFESQKDLLMSLFPDIKLIIIDHCEPYWLKKANKAQDLIKKLFIEDTVFLISAHQCSQNFIINYNELNLNPTTHIQKLNNQMLKCTAWLKEGLIENNKQSKFINKIKELSLNDPLFDERLSFYTLANIDINVMYNYFTIIRDYQKEDILFKKQMEKYGKDYIVVHKNDNMKIDTKYNIIYLNGISNYIIDTIKLMENAKEIHIFDSLYGTLVYFLYFTMGLLKIPIYYHKYARKKIPKFYDIDKIKNDVNWVLLE